MADLTKLVVGGKYRVKADSRGNSGFQYTSVWKKDGNPRSEYLKDGIFEVAEIDEEGDYVGFILKPSDMKRNSEKRTIIAKVEVRFFEEVSGAKPMPSAKPSAQAQPHGEVPNPYAGLPIIPADEASQGLASMFASLLLGSFNTPQVQEMVEKAIREVATQRIPRPLAVEFRGQSTVVDNVHEKFETVLKLLKASKEIMLVGEAGCGKTHMASQVAEALGLQFGAVSCSSDMASSVLLGYLIPAKGGEFEYVESDFIRCYENGGVFLLDEMDACDPAILLVINQALANGQITIPQRKGNTVAKRHKDFICMSACNTFGRGSNLMYSGRERLDESTLDRFRAGMVEMHYDPNLEEKLIDPEVLAWGRGVRERIEGARLKRVMSTRFLVKASALKEASGYTMQDIRDLYFVGWKQDEKIKVDQ